MVYPIKFISLSFTSSASTPVELSGYKLYDCTLKNNDDATIIKTIISKNVLKACSGKCIKIKALNNDFVLDCGFVEEWCYFDGRWRFKPLFLSHHTYILPHT